LQFRKYENSIDLYLKGTMPGKDNFFILLFIKIVMNLQSNGRYGISLLIMLWWLILGYLSMSKKGFGLGF
jgi:hypothetical protein